MSDHVLDHLMRRLSALPGLGPRSARRIALHLLTHRDTVLDPLIRIMEESARSLKTCGICGNLDAGDPCRICRDPIRQSETICVVAGISDLWAIERTRVFKGTYHVLGGVLSALDGIGPEDLNIDSLVGRVESGSVREVILALGVTVDGQSTAHLLADRLCGTGVRLTRLAHGVPVGGELDYLDDNTIATALRARSAA